MKIAFLAAALAFAFAPVAHAQLSCSEVTDFVGYALDDFDDIAGDEIDDDVYSVTQNFAGASECAISYEFDSVYACIWVYQSADEANAAYNAQSSALAPCLASGWKSETPDPGAADSGITPLRKVYYEGEGDNADLEWTVLMEEHQDNDVHDWHVWVSLAYLW
jgi:hypothetical protein